MKKNIFIILLLITINFGYSQVQNNIVLTNPTQEGTVIIESSPEIKNLIAEKIQFNATNANSSHNFRIQLFYGSENGALRTQSKFRELFSNTTTSLEYDSPNWKIKVGNYKTRLIADKHLQEIIISFGDAIVIEPKK